MWYQQRKLKLIVPTPKTERGKSMSRFNAMKSGVYAGDYILPGESFEAYDELRAQVFEEYAPSGSVEVALCQIFFISFGVLSVLTLPITPPTRGQCCKSNTWVAASMLLIPFRRTPLRSIIRSAAP